MSGARLPRKAAVYSEIARRFSRPRAARRRADAEIAGMSWTPTSSKQRPQAVFLRGVSPTVPPSAAALLARIGAGSLGAVLHDSACTQPPAAACLRRRPTTRDQAGHGDAAHGGRCSPWSTRRAACIPGTRGCPCSTRPGAASSTPSTSKIHARCLHQAAPAAPRDAHLRFPFALRFGLRRSGSRLSPRGKTKNAEVHDTAPTCGVYSWAPAFNALASCSICRMISVLQSRQ